MTTESKAEPLTRAQVAALCDVSIRTVSQWLSDEDLRSLAPEDVAAFLRKRWSEDKKAAPRGRPFRRGSDPRRCLEVLNR